ncbi:MAG TPA: hypothetical protein VGF88_11935 [Acidobacteriaceae bacterium]|jgi:hypothetical protein
MSEASQPDSTALPAPKWAARLFSLPVVLGLVLVWLLFVFGAKAGVADLDIWWHMRNASELVHTGHFVRADSWTFTVNGKPWINFEWLGELPYYFFFKWLGYRGLYLVMMVVSSSIVLGIYRLALMRSRDAIASFAVGVLAVLFATVSLAPRTLLFGWLFLVLEIGILWSLSRGKDYTAWLPPLFLVWINTHGSWFIGFAILIAYVALGWFEGEWGSVVATRWTPQQARKLLAVMTASFALLFVNPYGWRLVLYPLDVMFRQKDTMQYIAEWASLDFHTLRGKTMLATLFLLAVLQLVRRRQWTVQDVVLALIAVYGAVTYVRFVFMAGIVIAPLLAMDLRSNRAKKPDAPSRNAWMHAMAAFVLVTLMVLRFPTEQQLHAGVAEAFPEKAVPYVRSLAGQGNLMNNFNWGGYFEWNAPEVKEMLDSRVDIFVHEGVMSDYVSAARVQDTYAMLDKYRIQYVLLPPKDPASYLLSHSADWKQSYEDGQAVVFERVR